MHHDVLMIDDEEPLAASTTEYLASFDVRSTYVTTAEAALDLLATDTATVLLLDINLPGMSGFELCRRVRATSDASIVFLSARGSDDDQVHALTIGGDDYVRKPFSLAVLLAKVRRILDRRTGPTPQGTSGADAGYADDHLRVDAATGRVHVAGAEVSLTAMEDRLLRHLVANRGRVVPKAELLEQVWGSTFTGESTLSVHVRRLRTKIEPDADAPTYVRTVWGRGYLFEGRTP
ncbi:response regulator transcription factor [Georgenia sp. Z1344]|uniref:response regulator transcription factor n=1 Tax=Georgenia sp. Z1344 TaxID=3416706 RepID=UPI003CEDDBE7